MRHCISLLLLSLGFCQTLQADKAQTIYFYCDQGHYWKNSQLVSELKNLRYRVQGTRSLANLHDVKYIICYEVPGSGIHQLQQYPKHKRILVTWEPPAVLSYNFSPQNHAYFGTIFTWHDAYIQNQNVHKIFYTSAKPMIEDLVPFHKRKLCCLINKNIKRKYPTELCSARLRVAHFFENRAPHNLDLYGHGWRAFGSMNKGRIANKRNTIKQYKFCICYENSSEPGYITEKIFDCFRAGVVPVYLGAPNVELYIPKKCYIDPTDFGSLDKLYEHLTSMTAQEHAKYITHTKQYLASPTAQQFTDSQFVTTMIEALLGTSKQIWIQ